MKTFLHRVQKSLSSLFKRQSTNYRHLSDEMQQHIALLKETRERLEYVRWENVIRSSELKILSLSSFYKDIPVNSKPILCFDCLYDKHAEAIDCWTFFQYLQSIGKTAYYAIMESNPLYEKLKSENKLKGILPVSYEADLIIRYPDIIAQCGLVFSSFGYYESKIFKLLPTCRYVYIGHGVILLKRSILPIYLEGGSCDNDLMLVETKATKALYDRNGYFGRKMVCCGIPRWDNLPTTRNNNGDTYKVLIFFTWRFSFTRTDSHEEFKNYVSYIQKLIDSLSSAAGDNNRIKVYVTLHHALYFNCNVAQMCNFNNVELVQSNEVSQFIKTADLLITDYSSICFDFMYQNVPVIFYRFDTQTNYADSRDNDDISGAEQENEILYNVYNSLEDVISKFKFYIKNNFKLENELKDKNDHIFWQRSNNCERMLQIVERLQEK